jgi:hypothetical protein
MTEYISDPAHPEYNVVTDCREPTEDDLEFAFDNSLLLVRCLKDELAKERRKNAELEGRLKACQDECENYQAVSVRLLGELKAAQDGPVTSAQVLPELSGDDIPDGELPAWDQVADKLLENRQALWQRLADAEKDGEVEPVAWRRGERGI